MLNKALAMDTERSRWYIFTLYRIAELHAPHAKEQIMNQVKAKAPFQPLFDWEWDAYDRGIEKGIEKGALTGRINAYLEMLGRLIGTSEANAMLSGLDESQQEAALRQALEDCLFSAP